MESDDDSDFDTGDLAEAELNRWCNQVGIIATPPTKDHKGWDFFLNLPFSDRIDLIAAPPALSALVQVKGRRAAEFTTPQIRLSNWQRMIADPTPWFICLVLLDDDAQATQCALVHVGQTLVESAMKRIWMNKAGANEPLRDLKMGCPWSDSDLLPTLHGRALLEAMRRHIGDAHDYFATKSRWYRNAGIEDAKHAMVIKLPPDLGEQQMCDFALGKIAELPVAKLEVSKLRFGIALPDSNHENVRVSMSAPRSLGVSTIRISSTNPPYESVEASFETLTSLAVFPFLSRPYHRIRLNAPPLSIEICPASEDSRTDYEYSLSAQFDEQFRLGDLETSCRMIRILREDPDARTEFRLPFDNEWQPLAPPEVSKSFGDDPTGLLQAAPAAAATVRAFGLDPSLVIVTPNELIDQTKQFELLASLHSGTSQPMTFAFACREPADLVLIDKTVARVMVIGMELTDCYLVQCLAFYGLCRQAAQADMLEVEHPLVETLERRVLHKTDFEGASADAFAREMAERGRKTQVDKGREVLRVAGDA